MSTEPKPQIVAWEMYYDGMGGLKMHVWRKFMLIENYVVMGATDLETGTLNWTVSKNDDDDAAREQAVTLTRISEEWGCMLTEAPRFREAPAGADITRSWLERGVKGEAVMGLGELFDGTMRATSMDPLVSAREWSEIYA